MVLNFSILSQCFVVKLFNKSLLLMPRLQHIQKKLPTVGPGKDKKRKNAHMHFTKVYMSYFNRKLKLIFYDRVCEREHNKEARAVFCIHLFWSSHVFFFY